MYVLVYTMHDREAILLEILRVGARGQVLKSDNASELIAAAVELPSAHEPYFVSGISQMLL
ncbi:hypothetical protein [Novosphingobium sp. AP12]|uniref:hypothetical protein n=1 Tax=Novosphingobium sp. AP12 TaxID=1144305 RepID=UPI0012F8C958|nr:hypothetical protein [Novosphingobium sp. AP12]